MIASRHPSCYVKAQGVQLVLGPLYTALYHGVDVVSRGHGKQKGFVCQRTVS